MEADMQDFKLVRVVQRNYEFFSLVADPRIVVELLTKYEANEIQEAQRPWNEKRVQEIAKFVDGRFKDDDNKNSKGLIPNSPILNIKKELEIRKEGSDYYINLPTKNDEFARYSEAIEAIDGQHRIRAFMKEYRSLKDDVKYEMVFTVFDRLSKEDKKEIFMITNEKQEKVPANLLRLYKRELNLLKEDAEVFDLVEKLNVEDFSPLRGRIMIGANKVKKGYQESQFTKILQKSDSFATIKAFSNNNQDIMAKMISNYLIAWEKEYEVEFASPGKETITKISGLRYIFFMMPEVIELLKNRRESATVEHFRKIIHMIPDATETHIFGNFSSEDELKMISSWFRGETPTIELAKNHAKALKVYESKMSGTYDITEGL